MLSEKEQEGLVGMGRTIITENDVRKARDAQRLWAGLDPSVVPPPAPSLDNYTDRLLKYLPAESVALYLTLQGIVLSSFEGWWLIALLWFAFGIGSIGTLLYLWRGQQVTKIMQLAISTAAFVVWVLTLGGPFATLSWYKPAIGSILLLIFTFFVPLIKPDV
jgi:hypothetical protein